MAKTRIVIVSKTGVVSNTEITTKASTDIDELTETLSKKCDHKKSTGFSCYHTWRVRNKKNRFGFVMDSRPGSDTDTETNNSQSSIKYIYVDLWAKTDGRAGQENKYELPPPIDEIIFFGNIALVARIDKETACDLDVNRWNLIYEKLFGGFEDLANTAEADEKEFDELDLIPDSKKTKNGYLKDGFIVEDDLSSSSSEPKKKRGGKGTGRGGKGVTKKDIIGKACDDADNGWKTDSDNDCGLEISTTESEFKTETETESTGNSEVDNNVYDDDDDEDHDEVGVKRKCKPPTAVINIKHMTPSAATPTTTKPKGKNVPKTTVLKHAKPAKPAKSTKSAKQPKPVVETIESEEDELCEDEYE